jgi:diacylglycerol O-acyltransferase
MLLGLPSRTARAVTGTVDEVATGAMQAVRAAQIGAAAIAATRPRLTSPMSSLWGGSANRRASRIRLDAAELQQIRKQFGGTPHDVILAVIAGGLREWLLAGGHGDRIDAGWRARALIPVSLRRGRAEAAAAGNHLSGYLCDLPIELDDPIARLAAIHTAMHGNKASGPVQGPGAVAELAQQIPAAVHRLFTPLLGRAAPLLFDTLITTVPLPSTEAQLDGAPLREVYPIAPLAAGTALSIAATTAYQGGVHLGLLADPELLPDLDMLTKAISMAATEHAQR